MRKQNFGRAARLQEDRGWITRGTGDDGTRILAPGPRALQIGTGTNTNDDDNR